MSACAESRAEALEAHQARVLLETEGSTCYPPSSWEGYRWAEQGYCPEWCESELDGGATADDCVTVLRNGFSSILVPEGYRVVETWTCGERECPDCGPGTGNEASRPTCELCEGDGLIYWGEEWQGFVFAPRYSYGSGRSGRIYDSGPWPATSTDEAIDALCNDFAGCLEGQDEEDAMRAALRDSGSYRFAEPGNAGADYCKIVDMGAR